MARTYLSTDSAEVTVDRIRSRTAICPPIRTNVSKADDILLLQAAHKDAESGAFDMTNGDDEDLDTGRGSKGESIKAHGGIGALVACP